MNPRPAQPIQLYGTDISGHVHRVRLFLSMLDLPFEAVEVNLRAGAHKRPDFLARNAFGQVPVIVDGTLTLADSNAILVYLNARYAPDPARWLPQDPVGAAQVQRWLSVAAGPLASGPAAARVVCLFGLPTDAAELIRRSHALLAVMDAQLQAQDFLAGDAATLADLANYAYVARAPEGNVSLDAYPGCGPGSRRSRRCRASCRWCARRSAWRPDARRSSMNADHATITPTFHAGEQALQARVGARERLAEIGPLVIRDHMPDQHRAFFAQLPFLVVGSLDAQGQPWASMLAASEGFLQTPDAQHLHVAVWPDAADPLRAALTEGAALGLLGIEPHTRRRNRMNGRVEAIDAGGFTVAVSQSFGNCPKYIHLRHAQPVTRTPGAPQRMDVLDAAARALIAKADTFFIASAHPQTATGRTRAEGVDVSHRGGPAGFVQVDGNVLTVPDYAGNRFFNTLGNLLLAPRAGLLFVDFETGDLLQVGADAELVLDGPELKSFEGAERLLKLHVVAALRRPAALQLAWS